MTETIIVKSVEDYKDDYNALANKHNKIETEKYNEKRETLRIFTENLDKYLTIKYNDKIQVIKEEKDYAEKLLNSAKIEEAMNDPINPPGTIVYKWQFSYDDTLRTYYQSIINPNITGLVKIRTEDNKDNFNRYINIGNKYVHQYRKNSNKKFSAKIHTILEYWHPEGYTIENK